MRGASSGTAGTVLWFNRFDCRCRVEESVEARWRSRGRKRGGDREERTNPERALLGLSVGRRWRAAVARGTGGFRDRGRDHTDSTGADRVVPYLLRFQLGPDAQAACLSDSAS